MQQTLLQIETIWILAAWLVSGIVYLVIQGMRGKYSEIWQFAPVYLIGSVLIFYIFPRIEVLGIDPANPNGPLIARGIAIRGYGVCLLLAMVSGFGLALYRCHQIQFDGDKILSLGFWMVVVGLIGARAFYVIQKFDSFYSHGAVNFSKLFDMTAGGLVVYGSLIGGMLAATVFLIYHKLPWRTAADIMAPGMIVGLAIGRIGCLMNGCCYGGVCELPLPSVQFPPGSAPYVQQLRTGKLLGIDGNLDKDSQLIDVQSVENESLAEKHGVQPGDQLQVYLAHQQNDDAVLRLKAAKDGYQQMNVAAVIQYSESTEAPNTKPPAFIPASQLPDRSLATHPTQIYSAINAALLCAFLWFYYPYRKSPGEVFALLLCLYPVGRFILEIIRRDELGQFGTGFTISQWVSFGIFALGLALMVYVRTVPVKAAVKPNWPEG